MGKGKKKETGQQKLSEVNVLKAQLVRALADYDNLRKRIERDNEQMALVSNLKLILRLLPTIDMLDQAQIHLKDGGLAIAIGEFKNVLKDEGVIKLEIKVGDKYDAESCEVIETLPGTVDNNEAIAEILLPGYKYIGGPVIRHAKVKVYKLN